MPPENLAGFRERLATLEAQHKAMEKEHVMSVSALSERLDAHIEETERQFASVNASVSNSQVSIDTLTKTVSDFITVHNTLDGTKKDGKIALWQWLAILGAFAGPSLVEKLLKAVGF